MENLMVALRVVAAALGGQDMVRVVRRSWGPEPCGMRALSTTRSEMEMMPSRAAGWPARRRTIE